MPPPDWWGYRVRAEVSRDFLQGHGIEIGPGSSPQQLPPGATALYFDKRDAASLGELMRADIGFEVRPMSDIRTCFPDGADFLIAHNVLEHTADPIRTLIDWHSYIREGGAVVLSVPDWEFAWGDRFRFPATFEHVLLDYLLDRGEGAFESREHVLSFSVGWQQQDPQPQWSALEVGEFSAVLSRSMFREDHDFHWHALRAEDWRKSIVAAAAFAGTGVTIEQIVTHESQVEYRPEGEAIFIYRIAPAAAADAETAREIRDLRRKLLSAASLIPF